MRNIFLTLVRSGLWRTPAESSLFATLTPANWEIIYRMAQSQALLALVFDGIGTLPAELRPPRPLYLQWAAKTAQVKQANIRLNTELTKVLSLYQNAGLHPVLLKGQGIATNYATPLHRQCGDLDIYLGKAGQLVANRLIEEQGALTEGEASDKHASYSLRDVHIENHRVILRINNPLGNLYFRQLVKEWYPSKAETVEINSYSVRVPPATFNALYIFMHAFVHFLNSGIGLRQLCDWTLLLSVRSADIDAELLNRHLRKIGLLRAAQAFGYIAVHHLGLSSSQLPFSPEGVECLGEKLLKDVFATGNFGQHDARIKPRPDGYWAGKWYTFCRATRRCNALRQFAPAEAFFYPLTLIKGTVAIQINRLKKRRAHAVKNGGVRSLVGSFLYA